jgi:hypothetical protein
VPQQVFDVDPSRSMQLGRADVEVSGAGPRPLDADQLPVTHLFLLDITRPFERWTVLGRTGGEDVSVRFADLGLPDSTDRLVFEFWTRRLLPSTRAGFAFAPFDSTIRAQAYCIRERATHPQLVATGRHVTCGGPDLETVAWRSDALSGRSQVVGGDPYLLYVYEPRGRSASRVTATGATVVRQEVHDGLRVIELRSERSGTVSWNLEYARAGTGNR